MFDDFTLACGCLWFVMCNYDVPVIQLSVTFLSSQSTFDGKRIICVSAAPHAQLREVEPAPGDAVAVIEYEGAMIFM